MVAKTRELLKPNTSKRAQCLIAVFFVVLLSLAFSPVFGQEATFYEQLNPTGEPIGGDVGYSAILSPLEADFLVNTRAELLSALAAAQSGQVIYVDDEAEIDLTQDQDVIIPGGVTLASGRGRDGSRGGLIYSEALHPDQTYISTFKTGGPDVRITGLRLRGPYGHIGDHHYDIIGVANGIRGSHGYLEVDNCELWNWNKWAIDLEVANGDHIHHNYIHHNRRSGYGYGVWVRGTGTGVPPLEEDIPLIEANLFDHSRHHIGSGSQDDSSWEARFNISMHHNTQQRFDRHGSSHGGGHDTWIHHNWFIGTTDLDMHFRGPAGGTGLFYNNWSSEAFETNSVFVSSVVDGKEDNIEIYDNHVGGVDASWLPVAQISASFEEGVAPLTVTFDGMASYDPNGSKVIGYHWNFGDGDETLYEKSYGSEVEYTFRNPGTYFVELIAFNEYGIPSPITLVPIQVYPSDVPEYSVHGWIKDSYEGDETGYFKKQVLVDGEVVWEDDVAGSEGWQRVNIDISDRVSGQEDVELAVRVVAETSITNPAEQLIEMFVHIDNLSILGGSVFNGDFELYAPWGKESQGDSWINTWVSHEALTGGWSHFIGRGYNVTTNAGDFALIKQTVPLGSKATSVELGDVNGSGGVSALDAVNVIQHIVGNIELSGVYLDAADVSGNGDVSVYDASIIMKYVTGIVHCFPAAFDCSLE